MKKTVYYHINNLDDIYPIDIGHAIDNYWDIEEYYPYYSLNFLISGKTKLVIGDTEFNINPNQFFLVPPNQSVKYFSLDENESIEVYWINFYGKNCNEILSMTDFANNPVLSLSNKKNQSVLKSFIKTLHLCKNKNVQGLFSKQLLLYILGIFLVDANMFSTQKERKKNTNFTNILQMVNDNIFSPKLSEKFISAQCYISREHLSRMFHKNMKIHFSSYVNTERMKRATILLQSTDYPIARIAELVGYTDVFYFCKLFKKYRLMTPTEYRRSINL